MRVNSFRALACFSASLLPACFVVDEGAYNAAAARLDGGSAGDGSMMGAPAALCTSPNIFTIDQTTTGLEVNTSALGADVNISCSGTTSPGDDGFYRLVVGPGDYWHFHVSPTMGGMGWDPVLYVLQDCANPTAVCAARYYSNKCGTGAAPDEHFGVRFPTAGSWYIAVDEATATGGSYKLSAFHPTCGNGAVNTNDPVVAAAQAEHGEGCDDGNLVDDNVCDSKCRQVLQGAQELEVNDDQFWANVVPLTLLPSPVLSWEVAGNTIGTCDPDFFFVNVPVGKNLRVSALDGPGGACSTSIPFTLRVLNASASTTLATNPGGSGVCQQASVMTSGAYYVFVDHSAQVEGAPVNYHLKFELL